jgi:hypothetical protein
MLKFIGKLAYPTLAILDFYLVFISKYESRRCPNGTRFVPIHLSTKSFTKNL